MNNKNKWIVYLCAFIFGIVGIYLTFISGNTNKYDSETKAYRIDVNESYDSDGGYTYRPTYYFRVDGRDYECHTKGGSSSYPKDSKNTVYYDSKNPTNCKTEYEKSTSKLGGIICLVATGIIIYFFIIKKPVEIDESEQINEIDVEKQKQLEENMVKVMEVVDKVQLIYKRVILGVIIAILLILILIDTAIFNQTLKAKDYIDTTAKYVDVKDDNDTVFDNYIYEFLDKKGNRQEITVGISKNESPEEEIKIKYNENNPQDYYEESAVMDKSGIIWYIVKIVFLVLLIILFFNKKLLNKIGISVGR